MFFTCTDNTLFFFFAFSLEMKKARAYNKSRSIIIIHDTKLCSIFEIEDDDADDDGEMIMVNAQRRMQ